MILWPLVSGLHNCKVLHILFIRRAALCPFRLLLLPCMVPALPNGCDLWAPSPFCLCLIWPLMNVRLTDVSHIPRAEIDEQGFFFFIRTVQSRLTLCASRSFPHLLTCKNMKENLIHGLFFPSLSFLFFFFFFPTVTR